MAAAGGVVTGRVQLTGDYTDPKRTGDITSLATGAVHPIGLTYPPVDDAGQLGGALLAYVLLGKGQPTDLKQVLAGFSSLNMVKVEGNTRSPRRRRYSSSRAVRCRWTTQVARRNSR